MATASATLQQELRSMGDEELLTRLKEAKEELFNLRFQVATGSWTTTRACAPCVAVSRASTPSCASASSASPMSKLRPERQHE